MLCTVPLSSLCEAKGAGLPLVCVPPVLAEFLCRQSSASSEESKRYVRRPSTNGLGSIYLPEQLPKIPDHVLQLWSPLFHPALNVVCSRPIVESPPASWIEAALTPIGCEESNCSACVNRRSSVRSAPMPPSTTL